MGSNSDGSGEGAGRVRGLVLKTLVLLGGAFLLKRLTKATTRWDHARIVSESLSGEKVSLFSWSRPVFLFLIWLVIRARYFFFEVFSRAGRQRPRKLLQFKVEFFFYFP